ncbi:MAG: DAK2 domain-containing protein [Anaerolineae bacterium]|nr:DAK2 domain-containing protein [Anaerolineae bacterium]MDW8101967.1 DAK2 domain-containing protein [Anaerolineae bacterium]
MNGVENLAWDGITLKNMFKTATAWLERHVNFINALNVYPVPDGDTGTNMFLTMQACVREIEGVRENSAWMVAQKAAYGALMGARGNSGVILSQIWRGFAKALDKKDVIKVQDLAEALSEASATAYKGVIKPVEGTILTVIREIAETMQAIKHQTDDLKVALEHLVEAAKAAVAKTPSLLPILREAGVVDAGGQGLLVIMEGFLKYLRGEKLEEKIVPERAEIRAEVLEGEYGYDVQFIIKGQNLDVEEIRRTLSTMGDSVLVVGDSTTVKVHLHTNEPGTPLNYGIKWGALVDIVVENMQEQYREFIVSREAQPAPPRPVKRIAVVAVVPGKGLAEVFKSLSTDAIVSGGQTMNPSIEEILQALNSLEAEEIIVLPNNPNVILTAQQAAELSSKKVKVIPSRSIPQGISALLSFNPELTLEENAEAMAEAMKYVRTGEVTTAIRSSQVEGIRVSEGQFIGLLDGKLSAAGETPEETVFELLEKMEVQKGEVLTLYYGADVREEEACALANRIREAFPHLNVETIWGGQPYYHYIISLE